MCVQIACEHLTLVPVLYCDSGSVNSVTYTLFTFPLPFHCSWNWVQNVLPLTVAMICSAMCVNVQRWTRNMECLQHWPWVPSAIYCSTAKNIFQVLISWQIWNQIHLHSPMWTSIGQAGPTLCGVKHLSHGPKIKSKQTSLLLFLSQLPLPFLCRFWAVFQTAPLAHQNRAGLSRNVKVMSSTSTNAILLPLWKCPCESNQG